MRGPVRVDGIAGDRGAGSADRGRPGDAGVTACAATSENVLVVYSPHGREHLSYFAEPSRRGIRAWTSSSWTWAPRRSWTDSARSGPIPRPMCGGGRRPRSSPREPRQDTWSPSGPPGPTPWGRGPGSRRPLVRHLPHARGHRLQRGGRLPGGGPEGLGRGPGSPVAGEVIIREPLASGTMRAIFASIIQREIERTGDPDAGYEWLLRLDAQTREYVLNPTLLYQKLARQEGLITLWTMPDIEILRATTDFPINYILPPAARPSSSTGWGWWLEAGTPRWPGPSWNSLATRRPWWRRRSASSASPPGTTSPPSSSPSGSGGHAADHPHGGGRGGDPGPHPEWMRYWDDQIRRRGAAEGY
jgi:hypothetical protein